MKKELNAFDELRKKIGGGYAVKIAAKLEGVAARDVYYVFSGKCQNTDTVSKVLDAAELVAKEGEALKARLNNIAERYASTNQ